jgi:hypothetical protein
MHKRRIGQRALERLQLVLIQHKDLVTYGVAVESKIGRSPRQMNDGGASSLIGGLRDRYSDHTVPSGVLIKLVVRDNDDEPTAILLRAVLVGQSCMPNLTSVDSRRHADQSLVVVFFVRDGFQCCGLKHGIIV